MVGLGWGWFDLCALLTLSIRGLALLDIYGIGECVCVCVCVCVGESGFLASKVAGSVLSRR